MTGVWITPPVSQREAVGLGWRASERAVFTARRKEAYEALHPETRNGVIGATARHAPAKLADASFTADTAAKTGQSGRSGCAGSGKGCGNKPVGNLPLRCHYHSKQGGAIRQRASFRSDLAA